MANGNTREVRFRNLAEKAAPVADDQIPLADSADGGNPKRVRIGNLPGGSGGGAVLPANPSENDVLRYDGSDWVAGKIGAGAILTDGLDENRIFGDGVIEEGNLQTALRNKIPTIRGDGDVTKFLNERGAFTVPAGSGGGTDDQTAAEVSVDASGFDGNLSSADDTVQKALTTLDDLSAGGTDDQTAAEVSVDASAFDGRLSSADDTVQKALGTVDDLAAPADWAEAGNTDTIPDGKLERKAAQGTFIRQVAPQEDTTRFQTSSSESTTTIYLGAITRGGNYGTAVVANGETLRFNNLPSNRDVPAFLDGKFRFWARLNGTLRVRLEFVNTRTGDRTEIHDSVIRGSNAGAYAAFDITGENVATTLRGYGPGQQANQYDLDFKISNLVSGSDAYIQFRVAGYAADNGLTITHAATINSGVRPEALYGTGDKWDADDLDAATAARLLPVGGQTAAGVSVASAGFNGNLLPADDTVQKVAQKVDDLVLGSATPTASGIAVASSGFDGNLDATDDTVQKVAQALDDLDLTPSVPEVSSLPSDPDDDEVVDLTARVTIEDYGVFRFAASAPPHIRAGWHAGTPEFGHAFNVSPLINGITSYLTTAAANVRDRIVVERNPANTSAAATGISIRNITDGEAAVSHALEAVPAEPNNFRTATGIRLQTGKVYAVQVLFGATDAWPDRTLGPAPGKAPIRYQFRDERWYEVPHPDVPPIQGTFTALLQEHIIPINILSAASSTRGQTVAFNPVLDLDDETHGVIQFTVHDWRVQNPVGGFAVGRAASNTFSVTLQEIRDAIPYRATQSAGGQAFAEIAMSQTAQASAGDVTLYAVRDAQNRVGVYGDYAAGAGTSAAHGVVQVTITALFQRSGVPTAPAASQVTVDTLGFDGNLARTDDTVQKALQKFDDFAASGGGGGGPTLIFYEDPNVWSFSTGPPIVGDRGDTGAAVPSADANDVYALTIEIGASRAGDSALFSAAGTVFTGDVWSRLSAQNAGFTLSIRLHRSGTSNPSLQDVTLQFRRLSNGNIGINGPIPTFGNDTNLRKLRLWRLGGGGGSSSGGAELPDNYDPAAGETIAQRDVFFTADGLQAGGALAAMTWGPWFDLWSNTEAAAAVLHHDFDLHGVIQWQTTLGGDRTWFEVRGVRTRASVDTVLWASAIYVRNLNGDPSTAESSTRVGTLECSRVVPYQAGDTYKLQVRVRCQRAYPDSALGARTAALNFMRFPASNAAADANHINTYRLKG